MLLAVVAVGVDEAAVAAAIVAVVASSVSWSLGATTRPAAFAMGTASTLCVAVACGLVVGAGGHAVAAFAVFGVGVVVTAPRRSTIATLGWTFPFLALGASAGRISAWASPLVALLCGTGVLVVGAVVVAWSGPPPWRSRLATRWARRRVRGSHRGVWAALGALAGVSAGVAAIASARAAAVAVVALALAVEIAASVALSRVRLWRFVRSRRAVEVGLLEVGAVAAWCAAELAAGHRTAALLLAMAAAGLVFLTGATTIAIADRAESSRRRRHDRTDIEATW